MAGKSLQQISIYLNPCGAWEWGDISPGTKNLNRQWLPDPLFILHEEKKGRKGHKERLGEGGSHIEDILKQFSNILFIKSIKKYNEFAGEK